MRLFSSELVSATSSSPLLELRCITTLLPSTEGLELVVILRLTRADPGILTEPSEESSPLPRPPMLPSMPPVPLSRRHRQGELPCSQGLPEGERKLVPCCNLWGWQPDEVQSCDFPLSWGTFQGWKVRGDGLVPPPPAPFPERGLSSFLDLHLCVCVQRGKQGKYPAPKTNSVKFCWAEEAQHTACLALPNCAGQVPSSDVYGVFFLRAESLHLCFQFKFSHKCEQKACKVQHLPNCPI